MYFVFTWFGGFLLFLALFAAFNNFITSQGWLDPILYAHAHAPKILHDAHFVLRVRFEWNEIRSIYSKLDLNPHTDAEADTYHLRCNVSLVILIPPHSLPFFSYFCSCCWCSLIHFNSMLINNNMRKKCHWQSTVRFFVRSIFALVFVRHQSVDICKFSSN